MESLFQSLGLGDLSGYASVAQTALHIVLILVLATVALRLARKAFWLVRKYTVREDGNPEEIKRIETLSWVIRYIITVIIWVVALLLILSELGIAIAPILGAAGVVGIAVGFGAQSLVKDYFTGFFLLLENQLRRGDVVQIAGIGGLVEEMTLRYVRLRDYDGNVHFVPNNMITTVTNRSTEFAFSVIDVGVAYREDVDQCMEVMRRVGRELWEDPDWTGRILEDLEMAGVERWADSAVVLRCRFKTRALEQWNVRREYLRRLKRAFDREGIEIPYPHMTLYPGQDRQGEAPPLRLAMAGEAAALLREGGPKPVELAAKSGDQG